MFTILIVIAVLVLVNGFFAASEMALVSISPSDLHRLKSENAKNSGYLEKVTQDSTRYLSTIQVAITFAGFLSSAFAGSELSTYLTDYLSKVGITLSDSISVVIITVFLSFFTLVFGELVPKRIALIKSEGFALMCAPIIYYAMILFKPFVSLLTLSTRGVLRLVGIKAKSEEEAISEKDIKEMIVYGHIKGLYQSEEKEMMQRIFQFDDLTADMVMTPKMDVIGLNINRVNEQLLHSIIHSHYSRIPVFNGTKDRIVGVVLVKDILTELENKDLSEVDIKSLLREPVRIEKDMTLNKLLRLMRQTAEHIVFIYDEDDKLEGIVTLEDILEEIIGNIYDEHDHVTGDDEDTITYIIDGEMTVLEFITKLDIEIDEDNEMLMYDYLQKQLSEPAKVGDVIKMPYGDFKVLALKENKIDQLRLSIDY